MMRIAFAKTAGSRGSALLISLALLLILSLVALTTVKTSDMEMTIAGNSVRRTQALLASEAGLAQTESVLRAHPAQRNADTLMSWINAATSLPNTSFRVSMESTLPVRKVISFGTAREAQTAVQVLYKYTVNPYNIWNNAVFAGHGQDGMSIRGNTGVHGSVHILGNGEPYRDNNGNGQRDSGEPYTDANHDGAYDGPLQPNQVALDMTGTATISNNYLGMWAPLPSRVPPPPTVTYGGETVQSLSAELRVQHGHVVLDGSAKVGQPNTLGGSPAVKEPMDATWVTDGYAGTAASSAVFADNGYQEDYDLSASALTMPNLDDPYTDAGGTSYASYMAYLRSKAVVISGDLTIECGTALPMVSSGSSYISADAAGNITASGTIYVTGNVTIRGACPLQYDGRFTLVSERDVTFDTDFYSKGTFATDDVAGVISHGQLNLGVNASQLRMAGAFFAQEEVATNKQTQILGTLVSNFFDMRQVPDIYQVPLLTENLPPWMPGADYAYAYIWRRVPKSWTELF